MRRSLTARATGKRRIRNNDSTIPQQWRHLQKLPDLRATFWTESPILRVVRAVLIVNPQASATTPGGRARLIWAVSSQMKLDVVDTDRRGHAVEAAGAAVADDVDLVIVYGGDGTVNEAVNGMLGEDENNAHRNLPAFGVIPGGSTNVFARALGLPQDPEQATERLLNAMITDSRRQVGLGRAAHRWFTFNAGMGWDADVVAEIDRRRGKRTSPSLYVRTACSCYFRYRRDSPCMTVHAPGQQPKQVHTAFVSNTRPWSYLGPRPIWLNTGNSFAGDLGLFALTSFALPPVFRHLQQALRGQGEHHGRNLLRHNTLPRFDISCSQPVNLQVDGDLVGSRTHVEFTGVPNALTVAL